MRTTQDWIDHFKHTDLALQSRFLALAIDDCKEVLENANLLFDEGEQYESAENRIFGFKNNVVKFYRPGRWTHEALKEEVVFLKDLERANVPFVRAIGELNFLDGIPYIIFEKIKKPFLEDRSVLDRESVRKMVHAVARIHDVGEKRDAPSRAQFNVRAMSSGCFDVIKSAGFLPNNLECRYIEVINKLIKKIEGLGEIPIQRIHGDTYSGNILWKDDEPIFMDLDDFQVGPVALDVRLLSFPWRLDTLPESMDRKERRIIQHNMVLEMYKEVRPFSSTQEKLIPLLGAYRDIQFDAWFSARWNELGFSEKYKDNDITSKEYWEDSIDGLEESLNK